MALYPFFFFSNPSQTGEAAVLFTLMMFNFKAMACVSLFLCVWESDHKIKFSYNIDRNGHSPGAVLTSQELRGIDMQLRTEARGLALNVGENPVVTDGLSRIP